jgi:ribonuclease BN (tRNA processing enzyme)
LVYATDNEPGDRRGDRNVRLLAEGADVLIYDAQYTPEEMKAHRNWGHSNWKEGVRVAKECKVKKLVLFHHDPDRSDREIDRILRRARSHFPNTVAAKEGMVVRL